MAAGKYAHIVDKLPRYLGTEPEYQVKVEAVKAEMLKHPCTCGQTLEHWPDCDSLKEPRNFLPGSELSRMYAELRKKKDELEKIEKQINLELEAVSQMLVNQLEVEGVTSINLTGIGTTRIQYEPYAQVKDKEAFRLWCIKNGLERSLALPWQSTNSITKERLLAGDSEPDGIEAHTKVKVVLTRQQ